MAEEIKTTKKSMTTINTTMMKMKTTVAVACSLSLLSLLSVSLVLPTIAVEAFTTTTTTTTTTTSTNSAWTTTGTLHAFKRTSYASTDAIGYDLLVNTRKSTSSPSSSSSSDSLPTAFFPAPAESSEEDSSKTETRGAGTAPKKAVKAFYGVEPDTPPIYSAAPPAQAPAAVPVAAAAAAAAAEKSSSTSNKQQTGPFHIQDEDGGPIEDGAATALSKPATATATATMAATKASSTAGGTVPLPTQPSPNDSVRPYQATSGQLLFGDRNMEELLDEPTPTWLDNRISSTFSSSSPTQSSPVSVSSSPTSSSNNKSTEQSTPAVTDTTTASTAATAIAATPPQTTTTPPISAAAVLKGVEPDTSDIVVGVSSAANPGITWNKEALMPASPNAHLKPYQTKNGHLLFKDRTMDDLIDNVSPYGTYDHKIGHPNGMVRAMTPEESAASVAARLSPFSDPPPPSPSTSSSSLTTSSGTGGSSTPPLKLTASSTSSSSSSSLSLSGDTSSDERPTTTNGDGDGSTTVKEFPKAPSPNDQYRPYQQGHGVFQDRNMDDLLDRTR